MRFATLCSLLVISCGSTAEPPARPAVAGVDPAAAAIDDLRAGRFVDAEQAAGVVLAREPRSSRAAAVHAIAGYVRAGEAFRDEVEALVEHSGGARDVFGNPRGRDAWQALGDKLAAIDRDLAVAAADPDFSLELCLACWEHDWNRSGAIDERDRKLLEIELDEHGEELPAGDPRRRPTFRFDRGDADWARAMVSFQRALVELVLAYRWNELDQLFGDSDRVVVHLADAGRVRHARELVLAGLDFADRCRAEYLAETDDDREWVPNPRQHSHPVPLAVDNALYDTWASFTGDVRRLLASDDGLSLHEIAAQVEPRLVSELPDAYIDLGRMFREPTDIVIDLSSSKHAPDHDERMLRDILGNGYRDHMRASPIVSRLTRIKRDIERGDETAEKKLRYLLWLN